MGRSPCCAKEGLNRGAWSAREDQILITYINNYGEGKWRDLPQKAGLRRCGKSCRLRWLNYLRPDIKRGNITKDEDELIIRLHKLLGNRWSLIAGRLPGRTDNEIKNYWNTNLIKKVQGPTTQKSIKQFNKSEEKKLLIDGSMVMEPQVMVETPRVIRTKAVRCTKVVVIPPEEGNQMMIKKNVEPTWDGGSSSSNQQEDDSFNLLTNFDIGELLISNVLSCDVIQETDDHVVGGDDGGNNTSSSSDYPISAHMTMLEDSTSKEMVENWSTCDPPHVASELKTLVSFLDLEDEWMEA